MNISRVLVVVSTWCCLVQAADVPRTGDGKEATTKAAATIVAITSPNRLIPSREGSPVRHQYSRSWPQATGGCLAHHLPPQQELKPVDPTRLFDCP